MARSTLTKVTAANPAGAKEEVSSLEREAARLRTEVAAMEAEVLEARQREETAAFEAFDADGSGTVDTEELRKGLEVAAKQTVDESLARRVLQAHDADGDGVLGRTEFCLGSIMDTLERLVAEDREKEVQAWREERRRAEAERQRAEAEALLPPVNEDTGAATRIASVFVYLLPLADSVNYGVALSFFLVALLPVVPFLQSPLMGLLGVLEPLRFLHDLPFALVIIFFALQTLGADRRLPKLLRFNMRQACTLDITLSLLQLAKVGYEALNLPEDTVTLFSGECILFVVVAMCVAYSAACSLLGTVPVGIPGISAQVEGELARADVSGQASPKDGDPRA